jgi:hypothetical protein
MCEVERTEEEAVMNYINVLSQHLAGVLSKTTKSCHHYGIHLVYLK